MDETWTGVYKEYLKKMSDDELSAEVCTILRQGRGIDKGRPENSVALLLQLCHNDCVRRGTDKPFIDGHNRAVRETWYPDQEELDEEFR